MSYTIDQYFKDMKDITKLYFGNINPDQEHIVDEALDYSVKKRYKEFKIALENNYTDETRRTTLLKMTDYINEKRPIMTSYGTLFMQHGKVPNPLSEVVQSFLDMRGVYKKKMFEYPKGSTEYEFYNLMQSLEKVNANSLNSYMFNM